MMIVQSTPQLDANFAAGEPRTPRLRPSLGGTLNIIYRMSPDWRFMLQLVGEGILRDLKSPTDTWLDLYILPEDRPRLLAKIQAAVRAKSVFELEHRVRRANGTPGWIVSRAIPIFDEKGDILEWFGTAADVTARKQAEEALRQSEARFRVLFEAIDEGFCILQAVPDAEPPDFRYLAANAAFAAKSGLSDVTGKTVRECWGEDASGWIDLFAGILKTGAPARFERNLGMPERVIDIYAFRFDEDRKIGMMLQDVTERRMTEKRLAEMAAQSEQQRRLYETVLDNTPDLVYVFGLDHRFSYANGALLRMWGKSREEAAGKNCLELGYEPWHAQMHDREIDQVVADKAPVRGEVPFHGTDGRRIYEYIFAPVIGPDGSVEAVAGTARDVTQRKQHEVVIQNRSAQFAALLNHAPLGIILIDAEFRLQQVNPTAANIFDKVPDVIGRDFAEVLDLLLMPDAAEAVIERFRETLRSGEPYIAPEVRQEKKDGGPTEYYEYQVHRIPLPDGQHGLVCYFRDISAQICARERLQLLVHELNHRVKNTLATVQSIAFQTLRRAADLPQGRKTFEARLLALSKAHDVLTREHWEGARIRDIVQDALGPHQIGGRVITHGPDLKLQPRGALALSMALHELATNALKYGALSGEKGTVMINWQADEKFTLQWEERDGPPVMVPSRRGFGSRLIEQGLSQDLGGRVRLIFAPTGLICSIHAPTAEILAGLP